MNMCLYLFTQDDQQEPWAVEIGVDDEDTVEAVVSLFRAHLLQELNNERDNGPTSEAE